MPGRRLAFDRILLFATLALTVFGLAMVGSASLYTSLGSSAGASRFLLRQAAWSVAGLAVMVLLMWVDYRRLNRRWLVLAALSGAAALLVAVLFAEPIKGARRWLDLGAIHVQVSEPAKIVLALFLAWTLEHKVREQGDLRRGATAMGVVGGLMAVLVFVEPDTGTAFLMGLVTFVFLFLAGVRLRHLAALAGGAGACLLVAIALSPHRWDRIVTFLNPSADPLGKGFQINQSLIALGSGGLGGVGLGQGQQKAFYVPLPHSDFIFAVIGEELGLLGTMGVLLLFGLIVWRGLRAAMRAPDGFGTALALGLTLTIALQVLINAGVATALLPTKGLPLPFVSYGGSALLTSLAGMGVLLNISQHSN